MSFEEGVISAAIVVFTLAIGITIVISHEVGDRDGLGKFTAYGVHYECTKISKAGAD